MSVCIRPLHLDAVRCPGEPGWVQLSCGRPAQRGDSLPPSPSPLLPSSSSSPGSSSPPHPKGSRSVCCIPGAAGGCGLPACGRACPCQAERAAPGPPAEAAKGRSPPPAGATRRGRQLLRSGGTAGPPPSGRPPAQLCRWVPALRPRSALPTLAGWRLCGRLHFPPAGQSGPLCGLRLRELSRRLLRPVGSGPPSRNRAWASHQQCWGQVPSPRGPWPVPPSSLPITPVVTWAGNQPTGIGLCWKLGGGRGVLCKWGCDWLPAGPAAGSLTAA